MGERSFFVVWNLAGGPPTVRHENRRKAHAEAERLARLNRGQSFVVLESVSRHQVLDVVTIEYETDRDIPF